MPLIFNDKVTPAAFGCSLEAKDASSDSIVIVVVVSFEVIQGIGLEEALRVAERKYDDGMIENDGNVFVRQSDFQTQ